MALCTSASARRQYLSFRDILSSSFTFSLYQDNILPKDGMCGPVNFAHPDIQRHRACHAFTLVAACSTRVFSQKSSISPSHLHRMLELTGVGRGPGYDLLAKYSSHEGQKHIASKDRLIIQAIKPRELVARLSLVKINNIGGRPACRNLIII